MVRVECPHCRRRYRTKIEAFGRTAVCTRCANSFKIGESRPKFEWTPSDLGEDSWIGVEVPEDKQELKHCIICDAPLEPGTVTCPACGANQVTGVVHRTKPKPEPERKSVGSVIPIRLVLTLAAMGAIAAIGFYAISALTRSLVSTGDELAQQAVVRRAAERLADGAEPDTLCGKFPGAVTEDNLPIIARVLAAKDPLMRDAAGILIGCGEISRLGPVVELASSEDVATAGAALKALEHTGRVRLIRLAMAEEPVIWEPALQALCRVGRVECDKARLEALRSAGGPEGMVATLNGFDRAWPEAVGVFRVRYGEEEPASLAVEVSQLGRTFYLKTAHGEVASDPSRERTFTVTTAQWCRLAGSPIPLSGINEMLGGTTVLTSPYGVGWQGTVRVTTRRAGMAVLPGDLPGTAPPPGKPLDIPISLIRPGR